MWTLHDFLHLFIVCFGVVINLVAIAVILYKTPNSSREYSLLLLNTSLIELSSVLFHFLVNGRLFVDFPTVFCISNGPCHLVSNEFCAIVTGFMNINMIYSLSNLCLSFWYRKRILTEKGALGKIRVQMFVLLLLIPHVFHIAGFALTMTDRETLEPVLHRFHQLNSTRSYGLHGYINILDIVPGVIIGYLVGLAIILDIYIIFARRQLIGILYMKMSLMSENTRRCHVSFTKVLTIHAAIAFLLLVVLFVLSFIQGFFHLHSIGIEGLQYDIAVLPALINPTLTLYYVRTYRTFLHSCFTRMTCGCYSPNIVTPYKISRIQSSIQDKHRQYS